MSDRPTYTDAQIEKGIGLALERQDVNAVPGLIALLALQNPHRAEQIRETILFGLKIAADVNASGQASQDARLTKEE
jgi:hypothetical protein